MWFLQIAQLSTTISQAHSATAFHCWENHKYEVRHLPELVFLTQTLGFDIEHTTVDQNGE